LKDDVTNYAYIYCSFDYTITNNPGYKLSGELPLQISILNEEVFPNVEICRIAMNKGSGYFLFAMNEGNYWMDKLLLISHTIFGAEVTNGKGIINKPLNLTKGNVYYLGNINLVIDGKAFGIKSIFNNAVLDTEYLYSNFTEVSNLGLSNYSEVWFMQ
jgi:hypothetical protein